MEPQATALKKHACPACGGEAQWNPGKQALVCPFCGTTSPAELQPDPGGGPAQIVEHDLVQALRSIPDAQRGWGAAKTSVRCQTCHAISVFDAEHVGKRCDFCGATALVPYEQIKESFRPESLLPLKVSETQARERIRKWYSEVWFAPNALKRQALTDTVKGVYLPYWTFDAQVHAQWHAESGYHYYTTEEYTDDKGELRTRRIQHTRWQPSHGTLDHFFDDELVPASQGVPEWLLRKIEPFPTQELVPYSADFLSGWTVERYQIDLVQAAQRSQEIMERKTEAMCAKRVPGDTYRNLDVDCRFSDRTFKHILAPVWLLTYNYGAAAYQVAINGYTGKIAGKYPKSWVKITLFVLFILALIGTLYALFGRNTPEPARFSDAGTSSWVVETRSGWKEADTAGERCSRIQPTTEWVPTV